MWYNPGTISSDSYNRILYDRQIHRTVSDNKPEITLWRNSGKRCKLTEVSTPAVGGEKRHDLKSEV